MSNVYFPRDIIVDILSRLPAKCLCRFKCVSNTWRALISEPHFIKAHLNRHNHQERVFLISKHSFYSVDIDESYENNAIATKLVFPFVEYPYKVWGSCNGLLLVAVEDDENNKFLLNPSTREFRKLSISPFALDPITSYVIYGLGYDSSTDDYKVVTLSYYINEEEPNLAVANVYSMKTNSWRKIEDSPYGRFDNYPLSSKVGVFVNGSLHWLAHGALDYSSMIAAFDVAVENFRDVPLPRLFDDDNILFHELLFLGGCLCMLVFRNSLENEVWVMKEYGVRESWTKLTVSEDIASQTVPLRLSRDVKVLLSMSLNKLFVYKLNEAAGRNVAIHGIPDKFEAGGTYVESLVSPKFSNEIVA